MSHDRNLRTYRETDLQTMGKEKIIVLLYRKVIEHLEVSTEVAATDRAEMTRRLSLAQRIVTELRAALDHSVGGDVALNLDTLYEFVFSEILAMQVDREPEHAEAGIRVLQPLLDAWSQIPAGTSDRELAETRAPGTDPAPATENSPGTGYAVDAGGELRISISA